MRREFLAILVLAVAASLGSATLLAMHHAPAKTSDRSTPFDAGADGMTAWIAPASGDESIDANGRITAITRSPDADTWQVEILCNKNTVALEIALPPRIPLPFAKGDSVRVWVERSGGWHRLFDAGIWASDGATLMAVHTGALTPPEVPELKVSRGGPVDVERLQGGKQGVIQYAVIFAAPDGIARTSGAKWRRLQTTGKTFFVWGSSEEQHFSGPAVPDSVPNTFDWAIVRATTTR